MNADAFGRTRPPVASRSRRRVRSRECTGHGFLEIVYRRALVRELACRGVGVREEVAFPVFYKGQDVGRYVADILVENSLIVELKCSDALSPIHMAQTLNYLKASGLASALLINFGKPRVEYRRVVLTKHQTISR